MIVNMDVIIVTKNDIEIVNGNEKLNLPQRND